MGTKTPIEELTKCFRQNKAAFAPWIEYLRFPNYKALEENSRINFDFPITILVGKNGVNKTSILHALYGSPDQKSIGKYWFSTDVDKIDELNHAKQCMIYGYNHTKANKIVEVLKMRINNEENLDYWEPARQQKQYDMTDYDIPDFTRLGSSLKTRWETLVKDVVFCDNKEYVSAYDLLFYHSTYSGTKKIKSKQDFIRSRSRPLARLINNQTTSLIYRKKNRLISDNKLDKSIVDLISDIMGESYEEIRIIKHSLYTNLQRNDCMIRPAETIVIKKKGFQYSEAFAGSGESRLILLVDKIKSASKNSLLLIDEPEISLHPEAIHNFKNFLIKETLDKKMQVIVTTHSTHFIENFPPESIKLLERINNSVVIKENIDYRNAFYSIGANFNSKITVVVEDYFVKELLQYFINDTNELNLINNVKIIPFSGGAQSIISSIPYLATMGDLPKILIVLDGDQYRTVDNDIVKSEYLDSDYKIYSRNIPDSHNDNLENIVETIIGMKFDKIPINGNHLCDNTNSKHTFYRKIIDYWADHVTFLGKESTPEDYLITAIDKQSDLSGKDYFINLAKKQYGKEKIDAEEILQVQKMLFKDIEEISPLKKELNRIIDLIKALI